MPLYPFLRASSVHPVFKAGEMSRLPELIGSGQLSYRLPEVAIGCAAR